MFKFLSSLISNYNIQFLSTWIQGNNLHCEDYRVYIFSHIKYLRMLKFFTVKVCH